MNSPSPHHPASGDSEPAPPPSLPSDPALWGEADIKALREPAVAFSTRAAEQLSDHRQPTIGHIGRYALKHELGSGGLGTVYAAQDPLLSRLIAVKTLHVEIAENERAAFNAMFLNEARAAAGLNHAHIVTVFDAGVSDDRAYIAMELLKGRDLRQLRKEGWRPTPTQAALIVRRVADALGYAHSKGVIHRDVKPANIFMIGRTQPKVLDFGIARIAPRHRDATLSPDDEIVGGSPYYMAPEQARQEPTDRRADVFSLGVVLYELLTDTKPFRGRTLEDIIHAVLHDEPPAANAVDPSVPAALAEIASKALAKDPDDRYRSARAFARDLRHWLDESGQAATEADAATAAAVSAMRRRGLWALGGVASAALVAGIAWSQFGHRAPVASSATASTTTSPTTARGEPTHIVAAAPPNATAPTAAGSPGDATAPAGASAPAPAPAPAGASASAPAPAPATAAAIATARGAGVAQESIDATPSANGGTPASKTSPSPATGTAAPAVAVPANTAVAKAAAREKRAREREARIAAATAVATPAIPAARGLVRIAVSPWGEVEIDGKPAGASPPLTEISLPEGRHQIVIRNADLPPLSTVANVTAEQPVVVKHKF